MKKAANHPQEKKRLESLEALNILDTMAEKDFDEITLIASQIFETPIALISLVDDHRQWFKSKVGLTVTETPKDLAFCSHTILQKDVFVVKDSLQDERFFDNPLVTGESQVRFYAGAPLLSPDGFPIGTVCVIDSVPRELDPKKIQALQALSNQVSRLLDLRSQVARLKEAERALEINKTALKNISDGVILQDSSGKIIYFNPAALKILEMETDHLTGKTSLDSQWKSIHEDGRNWPGAEHPVSIALKTGVPQRDIVMGVYSMEGALKWVLVNATPLFGETGAKPEAVVASFSDVTPQINLQRTLATSEQNLRFILDGVPSMISQWDCNLINLHANRTHEFYFGKTPEELKGKHVRTLLGEELYKENLARFAEVLSGRGQTFERELALKDGSQRWIMVNYTPCEENGKVTGFLVITTDISELKRMEEQRRKLEVRLSEAARLSTLGEMAGGVAHEINNPLAIIQLKAGNLMSKLKIRLEDSGFETRELQAILDTVARIAKVTNNLLVYAKDGEHDNFEFVNLSRLIEGTLTLCHTRFENNSIPIRLRCSPSISIECRESQVSQLIMSLLSNSFDAIVNQNEKWIDIDVSVDGENIHTIFTDSGKGISEDVRQKMMQPFFTTKEVGEGSGMGLSISQSIAEAHQGSLNYDIHSKNTRMVLILPIKQPHRKIR